MIEFKDFPFSVASGGYPSVALASTVAKLNDWISANPAVRPISIESIKMLTDSGTVADSVRVWYAE